MNHSILPDSPERLVQSEEHRERLRMLRLDIEQRFSDRLARSGLLARWLLRRQMRNEFQREAERLRPSSRSV